MRFNAKMEKENAKLEKLDDALDDKVHCAGVKR